VERVLLPLLSNSPPDFPEMAFGLDIFDGCPNQFAYGDNFYQCAVWRSMTAQWAADAAKASPQVTAAQAAAAAGERQRLDAVKARTDAMTAAASAFASVVTGSDGLINPVASPSDVTSAGHSLHSAVSAIVGWSSRQNGISLSQTLSIQRACVATLSCRRSESSSSAHACFGSRTSRSRRRLDAICDRRLLLLLLLGVGAGVGAVALVAVAAQAGMVVARTAGDAGEASRRRTDRSSRGLEWTCTI